MTRQVVSEGGISGRSHDHGRADGLQIEGSGLLYSLWAARSFILESELAYRVKVVSSVSVNTHLRI